MKGVHQWVTRIGTTRLLFWQQSSPASPPCDNFSARYYPALDAALTAFDLAYVSEELARPHLFSGKRLPGLREISPRAFGAKQKAQSIF
jgi:hypothetical protein